MGANAISIIQQATYDKDYWTADKIEVLEKLLKKEVDYEQDLFTD